MQSGGTESVDVRQVGGERQRLEPHADERLARVDRSLEHRRRGLPQEPPTSNAQPRARQNVAKQDPQPTVQPPRSVVSLADRSGLSQTHSHGEPQRQLLIEWLFFGSR